MGALWLLGVYVAATGAVLAVGGSAKLAILHAGLLVAVAWTRRPRNAAARIVGDLLPLVVPPLLYGEIPALIGAIGSSYHDAVIQWIEIGIFRGEASRTFASAVPYLGISELLHAGYLAYYPAIFVPPLLLLARGERRGYAETVLATTITYLVCWTIFVVMPVEGPRYLWGASAGAPDGPMRRLVNAVLAAGSSRGAAFPSSHMAVMVAQTMLAMRWQRRTGAVLAVVSVLVGVGAVYGGFHYATDIVAGAVLGSVIALGVLFSSPTSLVR